MKTDPSNPVRYYKRAGENNTDTSEVVPPGSKGPLFGKKDFLLVLQSEEQAQMMEEYSRVVCVDGTHGLTTYNYYLMSIAVIDRHGQVVKYMVESYLIHPNVM